MKLPCCILFCVILTLTSTFVSGGFVLKGLSNTLEKVKSDVSHLLHINNEDRVVFKDNEEQEKNFNVRPEDATIVNTGRKGVEAETTTQPATTTVMSNVNSNSTDPKEGRENFVGGCSTGYQRTKDGRCMKVF